MRIYEHRGRIFVHGESATTPGTWLPAEPTSLASADDPLEVGRLVSAALAVEDAARREALWTDPFSTLATAADIVAITDFYDAAKCVEIEERAGLITLTPTWNKGPSGGFVPLGAEVTLVPDSDVALGRAVIAALEAAVRMTG